MNNNWNNFKELLNLQDYFLRNFIFIIIVILINNCVYAQADTLLLNITKATGIDKAKAYNKASLFYKLSKPDSAIYLANQALKISSEFNNDEVNASAYGNIAECYWYKSQFDSAINYYFIAIKISEKTNNKKQLASYNNGIGIVFYQLGNIDKAIFYMKIAADIKLKEGDLLYYASVNVNIAGAMQRLGKFNEAVAILKTSEKTLKDFKNVEILANLYNSLGSAYQLQQKNIDSAEYYYKKNIELIIDPAQDAFKLAAYINLADIYIQKNKLDLAEELLFKALIISNKLQKGVEKIAIYDGLSTLYESKKDYSKSLFYKKSQLSLNDSIFNIEKQTMLQDLDSKYQSNKKDLQIKEQDMLIEQDANKRNKLVIVFIIITFILILVFVYMLFQRKTKTEIEKAKQRFFSNVVHEIRTPLAMILAPLNILKQSKNTNDDLYHIDLAEKNISRLNELVNQMLDISKIEATKYKLTEQFGDIESFLKELITSYHNLASQKNLILISQLNLQSKLLFFDKDVFEKIIGNLLSNAIKNTTKGKQIGLTVSTFEFEATINVDIMVWDLGIGISKKEQEKVFDRFYRVKNADADLKGTGIGLSLVKDLVELYNGNISLISNENKGSTFIINIKLNKPDRYNNEYKNSTSGDSKKQLLIIEDDKDILEFNTKLFTEHYYEVFSAKNGKEAMLILENIIPDLIISDVMMPEMDGLEFLTHIKNNENTNHVPIIFLSAKASANSRLEVLNQGAQAYLVKPYFPDELIAIVKNQLAIITKKHIDFEQTIKTETLSIEQKFVGSEPFTQKLFQFIFQKFDSSELTVEYLADLMATNRSHFQRKTKTITGYSPSELIKIIRLEKASEFLKAKKGNITEVAYMSGFSSQSYFTKCFTEYFGKAPSNFI